MTKKLNIETETQRKLVESALCEKQSRVLTMLDAERAKSCEVRSQAVIRDLSEQAGMLSDFIEEVRN